MNAVRLSVLRECATWNVADLNTSTWCAVGHDASHINPPPPLLIFPVSWSHWQGLGSLGRIQDEAYRGLGRQGVICSWRFRMYIFIAR